MKNSAAGLSLVCAMFLSAALVASAGELGIFDGQNDIGSPSRKGAAAFEANGTTAVISGGGANMWFTNDALHFVWKRVSGDFSLRAAIEWLESGGNAHRKACLVVRQGLEPESAYIDVAVHGDGLTSVQFREAKGESTHEIQANVKGPRQVVLERQGDTFLMALPAGEGADGPAEPCGPFMRLKLADPVYVGLGVCAHDDVRLERARFANIRLETPGPAAIDTNRVLHSSLEIIPIRSRDRRVVYHTQGHFEAPNWSQDGSHLLFNSNGRIYRLPVKGGEPQAVDTGFAIKCNNDHGLSFDGKRLAISDQSRNGKSQIYVLPATGGTPQLVTPLAPSYWHGWSPDGSTLAYCAERNGEFDVYTIPSTGGEEKRLTTAKGLDDGPEYSADGRYIYFNSDRTGLMQIWRMRPDGTGQEQVTRDDFNNWFAHPSPDGKWLVFLTYEKSVLGHPANQSVRLRLMPVEGGQTTELARLFGGQGTINVPSWSPDSRELAFVSYELLAKRAAGR